MKGRVLFAILTVLGAPGWAGCYSYRLVSVEAAPLGATVRARLSPDEAARVGDILGVESRFVEGQLVERSESGVLFRVPTSALREAAAFGATHQRITVPIGGVQEIETRHLDRGRTTALVVAGAIVVGLVAKGAFGEQNRPPQGPGKGGTNNLRWPIWP